MTNDFLQANLLKKQGRSLKKGCPSFLLKQLS